MAASLDSLVNNLPKHAFNNVKRYYKGDKLSLLTRKGVYLYEYMNSPEKLKETKLPPREAFYSRLNDEGISDEDYTHAQKVWETFEMKNLEDYHNLYNQVDVLLLADVFENFRDICIKNYKLDPAHYYTAPGNYPPDHPSGIPSGLNKKVLGMFKDEAAGEVIDEFVGLRAKLYSYKMLEGEESKKCKGVKKSVVKKSITHENYKKCLFTGKDQLRKMNVIRSYRHEVYTEEVNKVALCPSDDKRHILEDGAHTLALGHYRIL